MITTEISNLAMCLLVSSILMCGESHAVACRDACRGCGFARYEIDAESLFRVDRVIVVRGLGVHVRGPSEVKHLSVLGE